MVDNSMCLLLQTNLLHYKCCIVFKKRISAAQYMQTLTLEAQHMCLKVCLFLHKTFKYLKYLLALSVLCFSTVFLNVNQQNSVKALTGISIEVKSGKKKKKFCFTFNHAERTTPGIVMCDTARNHFFLPFTAFFTKASGPEERQH